MIRIIILVLSLGYLTAYGQIRFSGTLTNGDGDPIIGAHLKLNEHTTISDLDGQFQFVELQPGHFMLDIKALGFISYADSFYMDKSQDQNIQLQEQDYDLEVVKLSASWIKPGQPFTYAQMNKEEIKAQNFGRDMPYLLQNLPSTVVTSDAGTGIGYTGIRVRGSDPSRINVTLDGVPVNDAESQGVFWVDLPDLASNSAAVQVQRGVGTSTNGAGAFGATVNIKTTGLEDHGYAIIDLSAGSFGTLRANTKFSTGILNRRFALQGSLSHIQSDGYIDRASSDLNSIYLSGIFLKDKSSLKINFLRGKEVTYQAWNGVPAQYINDTQLRTYNTAGLKNDGTFYDNEVDDYGQTHLHAIYHQQWNDLHLQTTLHYTHGEGFYEQYRSLEQLVDYGLNYPVNTDDLVRRRWLDNDYYGVIFNLQSTKSSHTWTLGGGANEYLGNHFGQVIWLATEGNIDPKEYYRNDATKRDANLFGQYLKRLPAGWSAFVDMQWRNVNYRFHGFASDLAKADQTVNHHFFNPKLGIEKKFKQIEAYYSIGVAHREPNRDDYVQSTPQSRPKAERLIDHELGAKMSTGRLSMAFNLFLMDYQDQLVLTGAINDVGEYNRINVPDSYRAGLEYTLNWKWTKALMIEGSFTFNRSRIRVVDEAIDSWDTGEQFIKEHRNVPISFSPEILGNVLIDWTLLRQRHFDLKIRPEHRFVGKQYLDNTGDEHAALTSYQQTDFGFFINWYPKTFKQITFKGQIINLFDRSIVSNGWVYRFISDGYDATRDDPHATRVSNGTYTLSGFYPQAGIHVLFGLTLTF